MHNPCVSDARFRFDLPVPPSDGIATDRLLVALVLSGMCAAQIADLTFADRDSLAHQSVTSEPAIRVSKSLDQ